MHPIGTDKPVLKTGQRIAAQLLIKKGEVVVELTLPENPALHVQPTGTLDPWLFTGHVTAEHTPLKNGKENDGVMVPEKPVLQEHPDVDGTFAPLLLAGQATAVQLPAYKPRGILNNCGRELEKPISHIHDGAPWALVGQTTRSHELV